jgi:catechol 2,3-dioxygenase
MRLANRQGEAQWQSDKEIRMSTSTQDIFGTAPTVEPATPGSYGEAPDGFRLPAATSVGAVTLQVADLERSVEFYRTTLGLAELGRENGRAHLGAGERPLVELRERRGARPARRGRLGLFHFAILMPDRPALGRFVQHLADLGIHAGAGDHLVSEAFYLSDPDGLGIEVYADRPRATWRRTGRELLMATDPLDVAAIAAAGAGAAWTGMPVGTSMGHVHLHVGDLALASRFYSAALGFDRTVWSYPGALFFSAGGYHHHLGTNVWAGAGARAPEADEAQLLEWSLELPDAAELPAAAESLASGGFAAEAAAGALRTRDPWGTALRLVSITRGAR